MMVWRMHDRDVDDYNVAARISRKYVELSEGVVNVLMNLFRSK